ncbi:MAG: hypothetical protein KME17_20225 [Cyanosarcina radialis HA8281-LM2]|nr:hypothetical protein [Cyanosarcina radialis HA8281-LM2]
MNFPQLIALDRSLEKTNSILSNDNLVPTISYRALEKTARTFEAIVQFYFPLHGLSETDFLRLMPALTFAEGAIYQIDEEYEAHVGDPNFVSQHLPVLRNVLTKLNLFDEALETELQRGLTYYRLEQQLCSGAAVTEEEIALSNRFKCFDCRFLNRLLFKLTDRPYDEELLDIVWLGEQIAEVEDDLMQYEDDVQRNVYNTYRMFVRLYGLEAPQHLLRYLEELHAEAERLMAMLAQNNPDLAETLFELWSTYRGSNEMPAIPAPILEG